MSNNKFQRYLWLVETIQRYQPVRYVILKNLWLEHPLSENGTIDFPMRTFHYQRNAIEKIFHLRIICNGNNEYYIEDFENIKLGQLRDWLFDTLSVYNNILLKENLYKRIHFDEIPAGKELLSIILQGMNSNYKLEFTYNSGYNDKTNKYLVEPYFLKVFKHRWYLVGKAENIRIFSLDRMSNLSATKKKFKFPEKMDVDEYFMDCFGIYNETDLKTMNIILRADKTQSKYLNALPLHHSQRLKIETENYTDYSVFLKPSLDFIQEILSMGNKIEIIEPISLRNHFKDLIKSMSDKY